MDSEQIQINKAKNAKIENLQYAQNEKVPMN